MFVICNYLDVEHKKNRTDGFVVEECSQYDESLSDYVIVCREHRINNIMTWAHANMEDKYSMFLKQFETNQTKAMIFVRLIGKIDSYTGEMVAQAGGLEEFKDMYCKPLGSDVSTLPVSDVSSITSEEEEPQEVEQEEKEQVEPEEQIEIISSNIGDTEEESKKIQEQPVYDMPQQVRHCNEMCIYYPDGTFKGFTEGQITNMLGKLHELDKRIALDTLNPEYILNEDELKKALPILDDVAPSMYKAFVTYLVMNASTEMERIRVSVLLDQLTSFINTIK